MTKLNVHEAKTHLSKYLDRVEAGETLILCRHNRPVAEVRPIQPGTKPQRRKFGIDEGKFRLGPEFFEPLPDDIIGSFNGEVED